MTSAFFFSAIRRYWYWVVAGLVVGALAAVTVSSAVLPKSYEASAKILLSAPTVADPTLSSPYVKDRMPTYAEFVKSEAVLAQARALIGADQSTTFLADRIDTRVEVDTVLISITARWSTPRGAADLANAVARSYGEIAPRLDNSAAPILKSDVVEAAMVPSAAAGLSPTALLMAGGTAGLTGGILIALLLRRYRPYTRTVDDLSEATDAEVLAVVAVPLVRGADPAGRPSALHRHSRRGGSGTVGSFATLYSRAGLAGQQASPRIIVVISTVDGAHAAAVAWGVAATSAASGQRCVLTAVDDAGRTALEIHAASMPAARAGTIPQLMGSEAFNIVPGGVTTVAGAGMMLRSAAVSKDVVVIAAPLPDSDANTRAFVELAGETLLAAPLRGTRVKTLRTASQMIRQTGASILGVVATIPTTARSQASAHIEVETEAVRIGARS